MCIRDRFTPHPDDDVFGAGGTIALLNRNHNKVLIVVYTNDDKGSYDLDMSSQRLAGIRRAEQEASEGILGTPKENIMWMGYDDGMLEYAAQPKLTEEATAIIRRVRPDVLLSVDPGEWYERWHKTDHRMAAFNTCLLYTSDAADERSSVDLGGRRIIKKKISLINI